MNFTTTVHMNDYDKVVKMRNRLKDAKGKLAPGMIMKSFSAERIIDSEGKDTKYYKVSFIVEAY